MTDSDSPIDELLETIKCYSNLKISAVDLRRPSTDTVVCIYQEILKAMGVDILNLRKPLKSETEFQLSYYDTDFRFIMKLFSVLNLLSKETSQRQLDVMDILEPNIHQTYAAVSVLHNFHVFRNCRKEELDKIVEQGTEDTERYKKLAAHKEKLRDEINYQSKQKAKSIVLQDELKSQISDAEVIVFTLIEEKEKIKESLEPLNKTLAEYDKISKAETEGIKLGQIIEKLKNQIVTSPDQFVQNLENLRAAEQQKKEEELRISEELQEKKSRFEKLADCARVAKEVWQEIKDINKEIDEIIRNEEMELSRLETETTKLSEQTSIKNEVVRWMKHSIEDHQKKIKSSEEYIVERNKEAQMKIKELENRKIAEVVRTIEEYKCKKQVCAKALQEYKDKITKEEEKDKYVVLKMQNEIKDVIQEVKELTDAFNKLSELFTEP